MRQSGRGASLTVGRISGPVLHLVDLPDCPQELLVHQGRISAPFSSTGLLPREARSLRS